MFQKAIQLSFMYAVAGSGFIDVQGETMFRNRNSSRFDKFRFSRMRGIITLIYESIFSDYLGLILLYHILAYSGNRFIIGNPESIGRR